jgi:hypothetical protein
MTQQESVPPLVTLLHDSPLLDMIDDAKTILRLSAVCKQARRQLQHMLATIRTACVRVMRDPRVWARMLRSITSLTFVEGPNVAALRFTVENLQHLRFQARHVSPTAVALIERMPKLRTLRIDGVISPDRIPSGLSLDVLAVQFDSRVSLHILRNCGVTHLRFALRRRFDVVGWREHDTECDALVELVLDVDDDIDDMVMIDFMWASTLGYQSTQCVPTTWLTD